MPAADTVPTIFGLDFRVWTVVTAAFSSLTALFSLPTARSVKRLSEKESARSAYRKYLEIAILHPEFAAEDITLDAFEGERRIQYRLFVGMLLHASEEILSRARDQEWQTTIRRQLSRHVAYLAKRLASSTKALCAPLFVRLQRETGNHA